MCNLYSVTTNQEAIRRLFRVGRDLTGNLPPLPGIFPDYMAPVVRVAEDGEREPTAVRRPARDRQLPQPHSRRTMHSP